jgi:uncharacterized protein (DUF58 family)
MFIMSYFFDELYIFSWAFLWLIILTAVIDALLLFANKNGISAERHTFYKLSNGDENEIGLEIESNYSYPVKVEVIDEIPEQFQFRNFSKKLKLESQTSFKFNYSVRPTSRGEFHFGNINVLARTQLGFVERKFAIDRKQMLPCYPSFLKLKQYELLTINGRLTDIGIKKTRRIGNSTEFDHIKEYVIGNDIRTINWKATARRGQLMVNHYRDERAQQVYSVIDMGRIMKMPFEGLTLLDYSINASLVLSHISYIKHDKPGLIGFSNEMNFAVAADRKGNQLFRLQEALYNAKTNFYETNYESLLVHLKAKVTQRSLLLLYTNFETLSGLKRQLKYIRQIAKNHLLVVIIFENTELDKLLTKNAENTYEIYLQTIARKFDYEKRLVALELQKSGIQCIYTKPADLTVNTINKYLELKSRGLI